MKTADSGFVLILHEVEDYPTWKAIFTNAAAMRHAAGEIDYQLLADEAEGRKIVHFSRWRSLGAAREFFESEALVEIRRRAGVHAPEFHYLREIERDLLGRG